MNDPSVKIGTIGGIFFNFLVLPWMDIEKTIILSATGALVSFLMSLFLRRITKSKRSVKEKGCPIRGGLFWFIDVYRSEVQTFNLSLRLRRIYMPYE